MNLHVYMYKYIYMYVYAYTHVPICILYFCVSKTFFQGMANWDFNGSSKSQPTNRLSHPWDLQKMGIAMYCLGRTYHT